MLTLELARAEFGFYAAHLALYRGALEPLHGHTFQVALRVSGEPRPDGTLVEFTAIRTAVRDAVAPLRRRTLIPGQAPELQIVPEQDGLSITDGRKRYLLPPADVTVLPLANTTLEAIAGHLLEQVVAHLRRPGLVAAELEVSEPPGTRATARAELS